MDLSKEIKWSINLEEYFSNIGEKAFCYGYLHKKAEAKYSYQRNFIDLPVIILSTITGTLSIGGGGLFGDMEQMAGVFIGCISLFVGILNTIGAYFGWSKRAENHRLSSINYFKLYRFISIELSLPREERMKCQDLLKVVRDQYERLQEVSPLIPDGILKDFKERFKNYTDISKPSETNGLEAIVIYKEEIEKTYEEQQITKFLKHTKSSPKINKDDIKIEVKHQDDIGLEMIHIKEENL
jgi:hypothetical protein